jgi:flavin-dependent dehydrogenase
MDFIEESFKTPVAGDFDVCVIGGSCTGVFAALRAAQEGARVALIELSGFFGGVATAGLVDIWHTLYDCEGGRQVIGGLTQEMLERLGARGAVAINARDNLFSYAVFNPPRW